jgi:hypothetical protein
MAGVGGVLDKVFREALMIGRMKEIKVHEFTGYFDMIASSSLSI